MPNFDVWKARGIDLAKTHRGHQWAIADWLSEGITEHGATATYDLAGQLFGYARQTFMDWASVARAFPPSSRDETLSFSHYKAVMSVEEARLRPDWLAQAREKELSVSDLRLAIAGHDKGSQDEKKEPDKNSKKAPPKKPKGYQLPLGIKEQLNLEKIAKLRRVTPATLAALAVKEFLETHADELAASDVLEARANAAYKAEIAVRSKQREEREKEIAVAKDLFERKKLAISALENIGTTSRHVEDTCPLRKMLSVQSNTLYQLRRALEWQTKLSDIEAAERLVLELNACLDDEPIFAGVLPGDEPTLIEAQDS
jgi:hypothetical protein